MARVVAQQASNPGQENRSWAPPPSEWSLDRELLASVFDRLGELITTTINVNAERPIQPPSRYPRPITEIDKAMARIEAAIEDELSGLIADAHQTWEAEHNHN